MRFASRWTVRRGGDVVREVVEEHDWYTLTPGDLERESGLPATAVAGSPVYVMRSSTGRA